MCTKAVIRSGGHHLKVVIQRNRSAFKIWIPYPRFKGSLHPTAGLCTLDGTTWDCLFRDHLSAGLCPGLHNSVLFAWA